MLARESTIDGIHQVRWDPDRGTRVTATGRDGDVVVLDFSPDGVDRRRLVDDPALPGLRGLLGNDLAVQLGDLYNRPVRIPEVDVVITHGGNNTITESLHFGKPMVVLPLFWDQVDNAQRVDETGFGRRLSTYAFRDEELTDAIDELLADEVLAERLGAMSRRIQAADGTTRAADLIERVARTGEALG